MLRARDRIQQARQVFRDNLMVWDVIVALLCAVPILASAAAIESKAWWAPWATALMLICAGVPLAWRRSRPELATAVVMVAHLLQLTLTTNPTGINVTVPIMSYALARYSRHRRAAHLLLGLACAGAVVGALDWSVFGSYRPDDPWPYLLSTLFGNFLVLLSAWAFGLLARQRQLSMTQLRERAEALERERDQRTKLAAEEERTRIAREMHDVVAHSLSVIVVQADGAAYAVRHGDPAAAEAIAGQALETIGGTAREALADTRRLVAVLRGGDGGVEYAPQARVADLDNLVQPLRQAGRSIDLVVAGDRVALPRDADLAAYRVVQEALTNVIKHAGPWASVRIEITYAPDAVLVSVADDGRGASAANDGSGHGIIGMRERVSAYGGALRAGPLAGGGFVVTARIPFGPEPASATTTSVAPAAAPPTDTITSPTQEGLPR